MAANEVGRARISMMVRSMSSNTRPDTLVQDRTLQAHRFLLQRTAGSIHVGRHAAPWSRKISATSSAGRDMTAGGYADGCCFLLFLDFLRDCDSRSSGLSTPAIMPVAKRV